jgi:hypothetical protein
MPKVERLPRNCSENQKSVAASSLRRSWIFVSPVASFDLSASTSRRKCEGNAHHCTNFLGVFTAAPSEIDLFCHRKRMLVSQMTVSFHRERSAIFMTKPAGDGGDVNSGFNGDGCV